MNKQFHNEKEELIQLSQGSEIAFEIIYNRYGHFLFKKITCILKNDALAQEILQEVFIIVWDTRKNIDTSKCFSGYLTAIVVNKCYDHLRKKTRAKKLGLKLLETREYASIEENLINKENTSLLYKVIGLLPPKRQLIFRLCKFDGKSYGQVSRELGLSLSTISDHIVKANIFIRTKLLQMLA